MGVDISIKNVPAEKVEQLKLRAKRNHRSLQGELRALIDDAIARGSRLTRSPETQPPAARRKTFEEAVAEIKKTPLRTPSESVWMIREDRDGR